MTLSIKRLYYTHRSSKRTDEKGQVTIPLQCSLKIRKRSNRPSGRRKPIGRHREMGEVEQTVTGRREAEKTITRSVNF
nr:MAG TPA: hypothetical protein [Caudoviricetes sp.]